MGQSPGGDGGDCHRGTDPQRLGAVGRLVGGSGATIVLVAPERSADLRDYYAKHTKTDRLDSRMLARLPLLHPEGLEPLDGLGPADSFKRAVRRRWSMVQRRQGCYQRLDALVELLGPGYGDALGTGEYSDTALAVLERYGDPRALRRLGRRRLTELVIRVSRGQCRQAKADDVLAAADEALRLWAEGGLDFDELAADLAAEIRVIRALSAEIDRLDIRIDGLYDRADPTGIVVSTPGLGVTLAAGILGRFGDLDRFANLAGVRSFTGLVPKIDQSGNSHGHGGPTKAGDPGLRMTLFLAADHARRADPQLAAKYYRLVVDQGKHHDSALCHLAATLATRIAACWRRREHYVLRDIDGRAITPMIRAPCSLVGSRADDLIAGREIDSYGYVSELADGKQGGRFHLGERTPLPGPFPEAGVCLAEQPIGCPGLGPYGADPTQAGRCLERLDRLFSRPDLTGGGRRLLMAYFERWRGREA